jgi:hypothetical protein
LIYLKRMADSAQVGLVVVRKRHLQYSRDVKDMHAWIFGWHGLC